MAEQPWRTLKQAAALFNVHPDTLRKWCTDGSMPSIKTPGGQYRFREADIAAYQDGLVPIIVPSSSPEAPPAAEPSRFDAAEFARAMKKPSNVTKLPERP